MLLWRRTGAAFVLIEFGGPDVPVRVACRVVEIQRARPAIRAVVAIAEPQRDSEDRGAVPAPYVSLFLVFAGKFPRSPRLCLRYLLLNRRRRKQKDGGPDVPGRAARRDVEIQRARPAIRDVGASAEPQRDSEERGL